MDSAATWRQKGPTFPPSLFGATLLRPDHYALVTPTARQDRDSRGPLSTHHKSFLPPSTHFAQIHRSHAHRVCGRTQKRRQMVTTSPAQRHDQTRTNSRSSTTPGDRPFMALPLTTNLPFCRLSSRPLLLLLVQHGVRYYYVRSN